MDDDGEKQQIPLGGVQILLFVSCMRLDVGCQTVVLDTAVLPLTLSLLPRIDSFLRDLVSSGVCQIQVDDGELALWKKVLPWYAERCRDYEHRDKCEYCLGKMAGVHDAANVLCSCGEGKLDKEFMTGLKGWRQVARFCTRAAISPLFSDPIVDMPYDPVQEGKILEATCATCGKAESAAGGKLSKCGGCKEVKYCSPGRQQKDWKGHERQCKKI